MTIVVSWVNKESTSCSTLWTVTDSRLSKKNSSEVQPILDCGAKLFSIRVVCVKPNQAGFFNDVYFSTTIGMAFAGSSLLALNLYAFLSYTLGTLASQNQAIPSMKDFAEHAAIAFQSLLNNYIKVNMDSTACEVSIFGNCPRTREYQLFHIAHQGKDTKISFNAVDMLNDDTIHFMGDHKKEIEQLIADHRASLGNKEGVGWLRYPKRIIESLIKGNNYDTIGGEMQLGISYPVGFKLLSLCRPIIFGQPNATFVYQNIDLSSNPLLMQIGGCFVSVEAMV